MPDSSNQTPLRFGLPAHAVVGPGEDAAELEAFCDRTRAALAPVGAVEGELATRAAQLLWRLRRPAAFEAAQAHRAASLPRPNASPPPTPPDQRAADLEARRAAVRAAVAAVEQDLDLCRGVLETKRDELHWSVPPAQAVHLLTRLHLYQHKRWDPAAATKPIPSKLLKAAVQASGMPEEWRPHYAQWTGWTVRHVRDMLEKRSPLKWLRPESAAAVVRAADAMLAVAHAAAATLDGQIAAAATPEGQAWAAREQVAHAERVRREVAGLGVLNEVELARVVRQESHLQRQLIQTLQLLSRMQQAVKVKAAPVPASPHAPG